jgi:hypothetical protein
MANWKKIIVSGSNASLNQITASGLYLPNLSGTNNTTPLVIDENGNISTGSAYALTPGGNGSTTIGSANDLSSDVVILGDGNAAIKNSTSGLNANFNSANVKGISSLTSSNAIFNVIALSGSTPQGTSSAADIFEGEFHTTESAALKILVPVTMSGVPVSTTETDVLLVGPNGEIVQRPSSELGGVTGVNGGTNISVNQSTGGITASLDDNISLTSVTASAGLFFSSSGAYPKDYTIDYAKVYSSSIDGEGATIIHSNILPESGSLNITASGIKVEGDLDADGNITLDGALSFNGFNFIESSVVVRSGSTIAGSGSVGANVLTTTHQFTGSVLITGSNLTLTGGDLTIPNKDGSGTINVADVLSNTAVASNVTTISTFNAHTESISQSLSAIHSHTASAVLRLNALESVTSSLESSIDSLNDSVESLSGHVTAILTETSSFSSSIAALNNFTSSTFVTIAEGTSQGQILVNSTDNIDINGLQSNDSPTFQDLTLNGDLTVLGTTTTFTTQDLVVEDRYIFIGSGALESNDVGIVFSSGSNLDKGVGIIYDASTNRFITAKEVDPDNGDAVEITPNNTTGNIATVKTLSSPLQESDILVGGDGEDANDIATHKTSAEFGEGEIAIDSANDIWIYVE